MSTPSTQDQVNRDHFRVPEWVRSREAAASRPTNARVRTYTLLFGVVSGLTFSLSSWIYEAVRARRLPCVRVGRHVRFLRSDLEHWVDQQRDE